MKADKARPSFGAWGEPDHTMRIWTVGDEGPPLELVGHEGAVNGLAFSPDGHRVASASFDQLPTVEADGGDRPLLMANKKTLFQRVLSKPGARFSSAAGVAAGDQPLPAFSVLYVYQRKRVGGSEWLRVGAASDGHSEGWLAADQVSDWKQSLVLKFSERSGRSPAMLCLA